MLSYASLKPGVNKYVSFLFREFRLPLLVSKYGNYSLNGNSEQVMVLSLYYTLIILKIKYFLFRSCELAEHKKAFWSLEGA